MIKAADGDKGGSVNFEEFWEFTLAKMRTEHQINIDHNREMQKQNQKNDQ